ncbi:RNA methyltransferase [Oligoflexaceae bacterium]|nr:RNA methyltransferase [Oligoflexaceae bacterium]
MDGDRLEVSFVLVESETSANVGAACRAIKNMGFSQLHLVRPNCDPLDDMARAVAHGAGDILESAKVWASFEEMAGHFPLRVATTCDERDTKKKYVAAESLPKFLSGESGLGSVALVFGRERNGLTTDEIEQCDFTSQLPMAQPHPALNLAQSVMLFAFLLRQFESKNYEQNRDQLALAPGEHKHFSEEMGLFLDRISFTSETRARKEIESRLPLLAARDKRLIMHILSRIPIV